MSAKRQPVRKVTNKPGGGGGAPRKAARGGAGGGAGGPILVSMRSTRRSPRTRQRHARAPKRSAAGLLACGEWVTGYNDEAPTCLATAIANSLLSVTGLRVTDDDVLLLFRQSGGGHGVSVADSLAALATHGIGGHRPASYAPLEGALGLGDIVGLAGTHAACFTENGPVSWGATVSGDWEPDGEAWRIDWAA